MQTSVRKSSGHFDQVAKFLRRTLALTAKHSIKYVFISVQYLKSIFVYIYKNTPWVYL